MTVHNSSAPLFFGSSKLLQLLATEFQQNRNLVTLNRLLLAISETGETIYLDELVSYLQSTVEKGIDPDYTVPFKPWRQ
jgi:hypothetical protein